jgi:hypothetical protein
VTTDPIAHGGGEGVGGHGCEGERMEGFWDGLQLPATRNHSSQPSRTALNPTYPASTTNRAMESQLRN